MKNFKITFLSILILSGSAVFAFDGGMPNMGGIQTMGAMGAGATQVHDLQMIKDMQFRHQEYNDFKDLKEQKEARLKKEQQEFNLTEPAMKRIYNQQPKQNVQFVEDGGHVRIQSVY